VRNIFDSDKLSVPQSTQKIFLITRTMFEDALRSVATGDKNLALGIGQRDFEVNKLLYVVKRQFYSVLMGKASGKIAEIGYYVNVAIQLERIADHAVQIAQITRAGVAQSSLYTSFTLIETSVRNLFDEAERAVASLNKVQAHTILDHDAAFKRLISDTKSKQKTSERLMIENSLDRLRGYLMNIAELTIDYSFIGMKQSVV